MIMTRVTVGMMMLVMMLLLMMLLMLIMMMMPTPMTSIMTMAMRMTKAVLLLLLPIVSFLLFVFLGFMPSSISTTFVLTWKPLYFLLAKLRSNPYTLLTDTVSLHFN